MKTVVGLFDTYAHAQKAAQDLENAGIPQNDISLLASNQNEQFGKNPTTESTTTTNTASAAIKDAEVGAGIGGVLGLLAGASLFVIPGLGWLAGAGWLAGLLGGAAVGGVAGGLIGALTHVGVPEEDATYYNEGVRRGGTLVTVRAEDSLASRVATILGNDGAVNIDERAAQWKQEGFLPTPLSGTSATTNTPQIKPVMVPAPAPVTNAQQTTRNAVGETVLPVIEEELAVGKRQVESGGVRVYSHVTERPVEEQVTLHEERVNVERRPVDRTANPNDINQLKDETIEVRATSEEAVISKQARVVEEVVVNKQATDRTQTVSDTVRRTDVEVEQIPGQTTTAGSTTNVGTTGGHDARNIANSATNTVQRTEGNVPGIQTGGRAVDGSGAPDTRGITEKIADTVTGNRVDDKTGRPV